MGGAGGGGGAAGVAEAGGVKTGREAHAGVGRAAGPREGRARGRALCTGREAVALA